MVTVKQVPDNEHLDEIRRRVNYVCGVCIGLGTHARIVDKAIPIIKRFRTQMDAYTAYASSSDLYAEEAEVLRAKIALRFRDVRDELADMQHRLRRALETVDKLVAITEMQNLLAACPDQ